MCVIRGHDAMKCKARGGYFRVDVCVCVCVGGGGGGGLNRSSKRESSSGVPGTCSPGKILKINRSSKMTGNAARTAEQL